MSIVIVATPTGPGYRAGERQCYGAADPCSFQEASYGVDEVGGRVVRRALATRRAPGGSGAITANRAVFR